MKVLTNNNIPVNAWNDFISRNVHATPFHLPSCFDFFNSIDNLSASAYAIEDGEVLKALAVVTVQAERGLAGFFSKREIIYAGPLAEENSPEALDMLLQAIGENTSKGGAIYSEIRNFSDYSLLKDVFRRNGYKYVPYLNFRVDTSDLELMKKRISNSRLRQIRKAHKQSVTCSEARDETEVRQFYSILRDLYAKKLHKPLPQEEFFLKFLKTGLGKYLLVRHEGKILGGIMCPLLEGRSIYEFYVCGMDEEYPDYYPSVMATWFAMEYACENKIPLFDLMGAGRPGEAYGVRDFKTRFGGELVEYGRFIKINRPLLYQIGKSGLKMKTYFGR